MTSIALDRVLADLGQPIPDRPEYRCTEPLDLFTRPDGEELSTQVAPGRQLWFRQLSADLAAGLDTGAGANSGANLEANSGANGDFNQGAIEVVLCEDDNAAWLPLAALARLAPAIGPYRAPIVSRSAIVDRIPQAIAFAQAAMAVPHCYLWGGTIAPDYDCSGLIQAAFMSVGVWLPRNSYQQQEFTEPVELENLQPGDLLFFGMPTKTNHVALYLGKTIGQHCYLHSSGYEQGRGRIAVDFLSDQGDRVAQAYFSQYKGAGRIHSSYQPSLKG